MQSQALRSVVITGTSTGIGWSAAKILLARGFRVFGSVRKAEDAARLQTELGANFVPLVFDVTDEAAVLAAAATVRGMLNGERLAGLVNNAGIAVAGPSLEVPLDDYRRQMEINVIGPISVTRAFAPLLGTDDNLKGPPGRIVMISSVSGVNGSPFVGPYSTSKHALEGFSESLRRELTMFGIDVIVIGPAAGEDADLGQGTGHGRVGVRQLAVLPGAADNAGDDARSRQQRSAGGADRRTGVRDAHRAASEGALRDLEGAVPAADDAHPAETADRSRHRQAARIGAEDGRLRRALP